MFFNLKQTIIGFSLKRSLKNIDPNYELCDLWAINKNAELRSEIDDFILNNYDRIAHDIDSIKIKKTIMKEFRSSSIKWSAKYNVHNVLIALYFSLDTKLYPLLICEHTQPLSNFTGIYLLYSDLIDGTLIDSYFKSYNYEVTSYLIEYINYFPKTSRERINYLLNESRPKSHFKKLANNFQYKSLLNSLSKDFSLTELEKHFQALKEANAYDAYSINFYYFFNIIFNLKDKFEKLEVYEKFIKDCLYEFNTSTNYIVHNSFEKNTLNGLCNIYNIIKDDIVFLNHSLDHTPDGYFFYNMRFLIPIVKHHKHTKPNIINFINKSKDNIFADSSLNFVELSDDFKLIKFEEVFNEFNQKHESFRFLEK